MTNTTPPPGNTPGMPKRAEEYQSRRFPHGYSPETAALLLVDLLAAIDLLNDGRKGRPNVGLDPLIDASKSLAHALADALEGMETEVTT